MTETIAKLDPREQHFRIASPIQSPDGGLKLFLRFLPAAGTNRREPPVLYVHGGTFPSALSIAHRFDGRSWRDALCDAGFDVWGLDFLGFGASDRYPQMRRPAEDYPPLCGALDAGGQLAAAVRFILDHQRLPRLSIIAHSWGSIPTGLFASRYPAAVDRLVLFAPIARRTGGRDENPPRVPAWRIITLEDQWARFTADVPPGAAPVLSRAHFAQWGEAYLDTDPESRDRRPPGVKIPTAPFAEIAQAWRGDLIYDPAQIRAPVAIIRGEWDSLLLDQDARWLFDALSASPDKRDIKIGKGTHLMHLETMRAALYRETIAFLQGHGAPAPGPIARPRAREAVPAVGGS